MIDNLFSERKAKLIILLKGGVGNQMFQYATGRSLAKKVNSELIIDSKTGFLRDTQYKRTYELGGLPINARIANNFEIALSWIYMLERKVLNKDVSEDLYLASRLYGNFLTEGLNYQYYSDVHKYINNRCVWLYGYWQSPNYFQFDRDLILKELYPSVPLERKYIELGRQMLQVESVSLGIRVYEESTNPSGHSSNGKLKSASEINLAITEMVKTNPYVIFFVFCTHKARILKDLKLPESTIYVTSDDGYDGSLETLWLISQCRHHIITNSSFYWWGAWLSQKIYKKVNLCQDIYLADNFINKNGLSEGWKTF
jgi:hypothetical protein